MKTLLFLFILVATGVLHAANADPAEKLTSVPVSKRIAETIVPLVDYREASLPEIVADLNKISKKLDPDKVGVQFNLSEAAKGSEANISISLRNIPLIELLKYVTNLANLKYEVTSRNVVIKTLGEK